jgi:Porin PorA
VRRVLGWVSIILGFTLIFAAIFFRVYAKPRIEKAPFDVDERKISFGAGKFFSPTQLTLVGPTRMEAIQIYKGIPEQSTEDVAVISLFSRTIDLDAQPSGDVTFSREIYAMDRREGTAVHCCGEKPRMEGETLKFPFGTQKDVVYPFWDSIARKAFPAKYTRDEVVDGLETFVFVSEVPPTDIGSLGLPGALVGQPDTPTVNVRHMYSATTTVWVEPTTGAILRAGRHALQWGADTSGTKLVELADINFIYSDATVQKAADDVEAKLSQLKIVTTWEPIFGPIAGVLLVILGLVLTRPRKTGGTQPSDASTARTRPAQPKPAGA